MNHSYRLTRLTNPDALLFLRNDPDSAHMARVADLGVIEHVDPHVQILAGHEVMIVLAAGLERAHDLQVPVAVLPFRHGMQIGSVALDLTLDEDARNNRANRDSRIELR